MIDLTRPRDFGELLGATFRLAAKHWRLFGAATLLVVTPFVLLVDGLWGHGLADGKDANAPHAAAFASTLLGFLIIPAMITALHVVIVQRLGRGERPTVGEAMDAAAERLVPAILALALYALAVVIGGILLVIPGIWLGTRFYFATQSAVVDGSTPRAAQFRSAELVDGHWWRVFGCLLLAGMVFALAGVPLGIPADLSSNGAVWALSSILTRTVTLSLTALFGTLLFFDLRARRAAAAAPVANAPTDADWQAPERPL